MADGLNPAQLDGINNSINTQGNAVIGAVNGARESVDGLHETTKANDQLLLEALNALPDEFKKVYETLSEVVESLKSTNEITQKSVDAQTNASAKAPDANKVGISTTQKDTDVASKVPLQYAAPSLMLNQTLKDLLGEKSLLFQEIQKITNGKTTKDKLNPPDKKKESKGGGIGIGGAAIGAGGAVAGLGIFGIVLGAIVSSAALFAKTPFGPALKAAIPARKFINELKTIIKAKDNPFPTVAEMKTFSKFCTEVKVSMTALQGAAVASTKMIIFGPLGFVGVKLSVPFINATIDLIEKVNKRAINIKRFKAFCVDLRTALSSLFKAAVWAFALLLVVVPGLIGLKIAVLFVNSAIRLMMKIDQAKVPNLTKIIKFITNLKILFRNLVEAAIYATLMAMFGISGTMGVMLSFLFLTVAIRLVSMLGNQAATHLKRGGSLDNLNKLVLKLKQLFLSLVFTMLFAIVAGILAIPATIALLGIGVFLLGVALIGLLAKFVKPHIDTFNMVSISLAIALLIFAIAFFIITQIMTKDFFLKVTLVMVGIVFVFALAALIGFAAGFAFPFIALFAAAAILLAIAFIFLFVGLLILNLININDEKIKKMDMIGQFFVVLASYVKYFLIGMVASLFFALASVLFLVAVIVFTIALVFLTISLGFLDALIAEKPPDGAPKGFTTYGGLAMIAMFFIAIGALMPFAILAMIASIPLLIASLLLMVSFIALTIAFVFVTILLGFFDAIGKDMFIVPLLVGLFFAAMALTAIPALIFIIAAIPILLASVMLLAIMIALTISFLLARVVMKSKLEPGQINEIRDSISTLFSIFGIKLMLLSIKVMIVALPILGAAVMIMGIMVSLVLAYKSIQKLKELQRNVDPRPVIEAVKSLMEIVQKAGEAMKGMSKKAAEAFAITLGAIVDAIDKMVDIIIKLSYFDTPEGEKQIETAIRSLRKVIDEFFLDEENGVLGIIGNLRGISKSKLRAAEALVPITEAINNIADVVIKMNGIENIDTGITNVTKLAEFVKKLIELASGFTPEPQGILGAVKGFFVGDTASSIAAGVEVVKKLPELVDVLASLNDNIQGIAGLDEASKNVIDMSNFVLELVEFAGTFKKGGWFSSGTEDEIKTAIGVIIALKPMIDELTILNNKVKFMVGLETSIQRTKLLVPFTNNILNIAITLSSNKSKIDKAVDAAKVLVNASNELVKMSKNIDQLQNLRVNLENNLVQPLMELDEPARRLQQVSSAVTKLNSELTKLARENKETLKTVASIGNASGGGILSFIGNTVNKLFGGNGGGGADPYSGEMSANIASIRKSVQNLENKLTKDNKTWTSPAQARGVR